MGTGFLASHYATLRPPPSPSLPCLTCLRRCCAGDMGVKGLEQASNQMGIGNPALLQSGGVSLLPAPTAPGAAAWSFPPNEQYGAPPTQQWGGPYVQPLTTAGAQGPAHQWGHPAATSPGGAPPGPGAHPWPAGPGTAGVAHNWGGGGTWGATTVKAPVIVYFLGDLSPPPPPPYPNKAQYFAQNNPTLYRIGTFFGRRLRR